MERLGTKTAGCITCCDGLTQGVCTIRFFRIVVLPAAGITFLDYVLEAEVGKNLALPLSFFGIHEGSRITFTQCHLLPLDVSVSGEKLMRWSISPRIPSTPRDRSARMMKTDISLVNFCLPLF